MKRTSLSSRLVRSAARSPALAITGPDVALSTVQPHQFLDFLSRKLDRNFVRDQASLERSLAERDHARDPDGRFRINTFFCHADSWRAALPVVS